MDHQFVFVHGWGASPDFWDGMLSYLPGINATKINLGFVGEQQSAVSEGVAIYVTHSLGTMWALKKCRPNLQALVSINGFSCFQDFTDKRTLQAMQMRLKRTPMQQMREFWTMCSMPSHDESDLNTASLGEGLEWLGSWDERETLDALGKPVLPLVGRNDPLLPVDAMKQHWNGFDTQVCEGAGHVLPITNARWCAEKIEDFVREL